MYNSYVHKMYIDCGYPLYHLCSVTVCKHVVRVKPDYACMCFHSMYIECENTFYHVWTCILRSRLYRVRDFIMFVSFDIVIMMYA